MPISAEMISHIGNSATYLSHLWVVEERRREIILNWTSRVNCLGRGGTLTKTGGTSGSEDAGAASSQTLTGNGYLEFRSDRRGIVWCGLSNTNPGVTSGTIQFAIKVDVDGKITILESGTTKYTSSVGAYRPNHLLRVQVENSVITYWLNRTKLYTSLATPTLPLMADATIRDRGGSIRRAVFGRLPTVIKVCNHTRNITVPDGLNITSGLYTALPLNPAKLAKSEGLKADNTEVSSILLDGGFTEPDLIRGRWNKARIEMYTINYEDLTMGHGRKFVGYLGEVGLRSGSFTAEIRSLSQLLNQQIGEVTGPLCRARLLGDERCGLDLTDHMFDCAISSITDDYHFTIDLSPAKADGYFEFGSMYWRDGNNHFNYGEIKNNVGNALTLKPLPLLEVEVGDLVTVIAGCDRTRAKCQTFPNPDNPSGTNIENMVAEPDIPGLRKLYAFPS